MTDEQRHIAPIEEAQEVLADVHQVDPYGIGGMSAEDLADFRGWMEQAWPPPRRNHKQRRAAAMWEKAGPDAPQCHVCFAPCVAVDGRTVCLRCERIQP